MELIKDLGQDYRTNKSTSKVRYGIYKCPFCNEEFKAATPDIKSKRIISCGCQKRIKKLPKEINGFIVIKDLKMIHGARMAEFICKKCKKPFITRVTNIKTKKSNSCGCLPKNKIHGFSSTRLYNIFQGIKDRCYKNNRKDKKYYYDKNIKICNEWLKDSSIFFKWSMENGYNENLTIDRKDNTKDYSSENCRWVSYHEQAINKQTLNSRNTTGYRGVTFIKKTKKYNSRICIYGKRITIGTYNTKEEAGTAYDNYIDNNNLVNYIKNSEIL